MGFRVGNYVVVRNNVTKDILAYDLFSETYDECGNTMQREIDAMFGKPLKVVAVEDDYTLLLDNDYYVGENMVELFEEEPFEETLKIDNVTKPDINDFTEYAKPIQKILNKIWKDTGVEHALEIGVTYAELKENKGIHLFPCNCEED